MSTVGRMGWTFALMKVLTRSRGTPAAAFAMYCSRNVLVDTDQAIVQAKGQETKRFLPSGRRRVFLARAFRARTRSDPHVLVDRARDAGVDRAGASDRSAEPDDVRLRTISMAVGGDGVEIEDPARRRVFAHFQRSPAGVPGDLPEVPPLVAERDRRPEAVVDEVFVAPRAVDHAEGDRVRRHVLRAALLDGEAVVVRRDVAEAFLHAHDLRLVARRSFVEPGDHHGELAGFERLRQL